MFTDKSSEWKKVAEFLNHWNSTADVRKTRIYGNEEGSHEQERNPAIYMEFEQNNYNMFGNICIVITDEDFSKYDFSSLKTYKFEENPVDEEDECENDEN